MEALLYYYSFTLGAGSLRGIAILSLFAEYPISSLCKSSDGSRPVLLADPFFPPINSVSRGLLRIINQRHDLIHFALKALRSPSLLLTCGVEVNRKLPQGLQIL